VERPGDTPVQGRIGVTENDPDRASEFFQLGVICVRDRTMDNKSSFRRKKAGRALGVASNCWYSSGTNLRLTSASRMNLPTCPSGGRASSRTSNKIARMAWAMMVRGERFKEPKLLPAA
jgi:hypothetical protein